MIIAQQRDKDDPTKREINERRKKQEELRKKERTEKDGDKDRDRYEQDSMKKSSTH
jgi:hypothetical protein